MHFDETSSQDQYEFDTIISILICLLQTETTLLQNSDRANVVLCYVSVQRAICHQLQERSKRLGSNTFAPVFFADPVPD